PTARRSSSRVDSLTPARRATAVAMSLAVRTCAGSALIVSWTTAIVGLRLLRLALVDGLLHRLVDTEDLGQTGDPEDLQDPLLGADQVQGAVVGPHALETAHKHTEPGRVEELHLLHVDDEVVVALVHQVDEELSQARRRIDVDFPFDDDDLGVVLGVVIKLQVHWSSSTEQRKLTRDPLPGVTLSGRNSITPGCCIYGKVKKTTP